MAGENRFGLQRAIDEATKREVRQRCGFGCVCCGDAIYEYEHLSPEFKDATKHDPAGIVLLCGGCHSKVTRGILSKAVVQEAAKAPRCKEQGYSFGPLAFSPGDITVRVGGCTFTGVRNLIQLNGETVLSVTPPEVPGSPVRVNALMTDTTGREVLRIVENEWRTRDDNWDVTAIGPRVSIRRGPGEIVLVMRVGGPQELVIERLSMSHLGVLLEADERNYTVITNGVRMNGNQMSVHGCEHGIVVSGSSIMLGMGGGSTSFSGTISFR